MNFKKLPKEKRDQLVLVVLVTVVALAGIGFGLIRFQYESLKRARDKEREAVARLEKMKNTIQRADQIEAEFTAINQSLQSLEEGMATGDPYSWALDLIRRYRLSHRVDLPLIGQPVIGEVTMLPKFPYRQASFALSGTGFYHDIGRFIADFENQFPEMRVQNLTLTPVSGLLQAEKEKLEFKMDVVALVRPNPS